jgi:hypothetical protein
MGNDLLGKKAWAYVCDTLGLGQEFDWTCEAVDSVVDCDVYEDIESKIIRCDLPEGIKYVRMVYEGEYAHGIISFFTIDPRE